MARITLVSRTHFEHDGRTFVPGQVFTVEPIHAAALVYRQKAIFAPPGAVETPSKRTYRRRDLVAEP